MKNVFKLPQLFSLIIFRPATCGSRRHATCAVATPGLLACSVQMDHNQYGYISADRNSRLHLGNAIYHGGPHSRFDAPTALHGNMTINMIHPASSSNQQVEDPLTTLKKALYYPSMETRQAQLSSIKPASVDWIWTETDFPRWLHNDSGLYWIQGKPASGKSTLIRCQTMPCKQTRLGNQV